MGCHPCSGFDRCWRGSHSAYPPTWRFDFACLASASLPCRLGFGRSGGVSPQSPAPIGPPWRATSDCLGGWGSQQSWYGRSCACCLGRAFWVLGFGLLRPCTRGSNSAESRALCGLAGAGPPMRSPSHRHRLHVCPSRLSRFGDLGHGPFPLPPGFVGRGSGTRRWTGGYHALGTGPSIGA